MSTNASPSPQPSGSSAPVSSTSSIPQTAPAGLITITQPPQTATSYYKIAQGETITFGWNFSYVLVQPSSLTVSAICDNGNTYPVGPSDGKIPGTATSVQWDLWSYEQAFPETPLGQEKCTLNIWGDQGPGAQRSPGVLQENTGLQFALYSPQPYTPLQSWNCPGCNTNASLSDYVAHPAFLSLLVTLVVMFLSGYQLLRNTGH
ncbi:hypothetical protein BC835DRAFT_1547154 [Cytidiella melzeri]|nr:hypothetical protein BC835DRAFT_1547154 [Cytidiella melzeri]